MLMSKSEILERFGCFDLYAVAYNDSCELPSIIVVAINGIVSFRFYVQDGEVYRLMARNLDIPIQDYIAQRLDMQAVVSKLN